MAIAPEYLKITYSHEQIQVSSGNVLLPFANSPLFTTNIKGHELLTSGIDVKRVYDVALDLQEIDCNYKAGDAIGILPENDCNELDSIFELLNLFDVVDQSYTLSVLEATTKKKPAIPGHIPSTGTLRNTFKRYLDVRSVPKKLFLKMLAEFTSNMDEKQELLSLCDPKQNNEYSLFIGNGGATLLSILNKFQSCKPPVHRLLEHLPALKPRYYSISSASQNQTKNDCLHITFAVIDLLDGFKGVCTGYLEKLLLSTESDSVEKKNVQFYFRKSNNFLVFDNVDCDTKPLILIGPGTGVAPFMGFLEEQQTTQQGETLLFFGCRYSDRDFLYKDRLQAYVTSSENVLSHLYTAFSRETNEKIYVQDAIKQNGRQVCDLLLNQGAFVRLCGDAKLLLQSIDTVLISVLVDFGDMDQGEAQDFVVELKRSHRYMMDIWT